MILNNLFTMLSFYIISIFFKILFIAPYIHSYIAIQNFINSCLIYGFFPLKVDARQLTFGMQLQLKDNSLTHSHSVVSGQEKRKLH